MTRIAQATVLIALAAALLPGPRGAHAQDLRALDTADAARGWEAVGRLDTPVSFCSATLIAPDLVLTAAHCLYGPDGARLDDADLRFSASLRNGRAEAYRGVRQSRQPLEYPGPDGGTGSEIIGHDIALLHLDRPIPPQTVMPIGLGAPGQVHDTVTVVSYGEDRETMASIEEDCEILADQGRVQILSCDVVSGSSGAPILRVEAGRPEVIAVVSARARWNGDAVSVGVSTADVVSGILATPAPVAPAATRMPAGVRRLSPGGDARPDIGARFLRP